MRRGVCAQQSVPAERTRSIFVFEFEIRFQLCSQIPTSLALESQQSHALDIEHEDPAPITQYGAGRNLNRRDELAVQDQTPNARTQIRATSFWHSDGRPSGTAYGR